MTRSSYSFRVSTWLSCNFRLLLTRVNRGACVDVDSNGDGLPAEDGGRRMQDQRAAAAMRMGMSPPFAKDGAIGSRNRRIPPQQSHDGVIHLFYIARKS